MTQRPTDAPVRLGRYELLGEIASGGMATVFLARVSGAGGFTRLVAIKRLHPHLETEEEFVRMFLDEARLAARIRHPNVVGTLDVEDRDGLYIVMEFIEGVTLLQLSREAQRQGERIPAPVAVRIALDTLAGLHAAHELRDENDVFLNLVHRDVSPQNILLGLDGTARLTDFGIAKARSRLSLTRDGQLKGKVSYMAPEQTRRGEALDRRADVFAMGAVVWELLAGRRLFQGESDVEVLNQLLFEPMPRLREFAPTLPSMLEGVVTKALERDATARYATAAQFAEALERASRMLGGAANHRVVAAFVQRVAGERIAKERSRISLGSVPPDAPLTGSLRASLTPAPTPSRLRPASNPHAERPSVPRARLRAPTMTGPVYAPPSSVPAAPPAEAQEVPRVSLRARSHPSALRPPTLPGASPQAGAEASEFIPTVPPPPSPALPAVIEFDISEDPDAAPVPAPVPSPLRAATQPGLLPTPVSSLPGTDPTAASQAASHPDDAAPFPPIELSYQHIPSASSLSREIDATPLREPPEGVSEGVPPAHLRSVPPTPIDPVPTVTAHALELPSAPRGPDSSLPEHRSSTEVPSSPSPEASATPPPSPPSGVRRGLWITLSLVLVVSLGGVLGLYAAGVLPPARRSVADPPVRVRPPVFPDASGLVPADSEAVTPGVRTLADASEAIDEGRADEASSFMGLTPHDVAEERLSDTDLDGAVPLQVDASRVDLDGAVPLQVDASRVDLDGAVPLQVDASRVDPDVSDGREDTVNELPESSQDERRHRRRHRRHRDDGA